MSDVVTPADDEDGSGDAGGTGGRRSSRTRKAAELAAVVSAVTALAALVFGLLGVIGTGGAAGEGRDAGSGPSTGEAAPPAESPSASTTGTPPISSAPPAATRTPSPSPTSAPPPLPRGWHVVRSKALRVEVAVPDGWKLATDTALQSTWVSPDDRYRIGVKRDGTHGSTAQSAAIGQLAWYRKPEESKMEALQAATHPDRQGGKPAVRLEMDFHWPASAVPCHRTEIFVAGEGGQVYQLHVNDQQYGTKPSALPQLLATARAQLRTDLTV
ncbi:hypothetical protein [Streptomyces sp. NPDC047981]|uniref:hypothetical protein n=1 Tax=Streptomyces sp. NPDC047981 TaxID=3154610 RepID=UPI0034382F07